MISNNNKDYKNNLITKRIKGVQFGLYNPDEILKGSVLEVTIPDTYDGTIPKVNGLFDIRMGVIDSGILCDTCENNNKDCPGHMGHIALAQPIYYYQYIKQIVNILKYTCFRCSNLLIDKSNIVFINYIKTLNNKDRLTAISNKYPSQSKVKTCNFNDGCGIMQPLKYSKLTLEKIKNKDAIVQILAEFSPDAFNDANINSQQIITPEMALSIFSRITNEDSSLLGFDPINARPEWMICTILPVAPPSVRPSVTQNETQKSEDDLTHKYSDIIKTNKTLKQKIETNAPEHIINSCRALLELHIYTLVDNDSMKQLSSRHKSRSGRPLKTIAQRLKGKEGRLKYNLMGKRVDYSARTVISVDPNLNIDQYGVPIKICMNLTYPEVATKYNINVLQTYVNNGYNVYPGAKIVHKKKSNDNIRLQYIDKDKAPGDVSSVKLELGDVVHRHLQDDDIALFNRQPSLHKMSMMAHKIKVLHQGSTFRLNVFVTDPYNADQLH
jgi:DNA-directed RNA polymerase II subunit RPB1